MSLRPAILAASGVLALLAAGCSASVPGATPAQIPSIPVVTTAATVATPDTTMPTATPSESPTLGSIVSPTVTSATPLVPGLITAPAGTIVNLSTDNAFHADGWTYGNFLPAGTSVVIPALAATVNCDAEGPAMEYRLSPTYGTLKVTVAQDVLSDSSDNTVNVQITADGKVVAEKAIKFKQQADLSASLAGVTVVKLTASPKGTCHTSSTALITKALVQG